MDSNSKTTTTALGGAFKTSTETRREFLLGMATRDARSL
jgi:GTP cyclohydrolase I